jgi:hypothetical protein
MTERRPKRRKTKTSLMTMRNRMTRRKTSRKLLMTQTTKRTKKRTKNWMNQTLNRSKNRQGLFRAFLGALSKSSKYTSEVLNEHERVSPQSLLISLFAVGFFSPSAPLLSV